MTNVRRIIAEEIAQRGVIPFERFMELALYCPNSGYYDSNLKSPGRQGDFFTSVSTGPLFGELLARQFAEWLETSPTGPIQIVEAGSHDGRLAADILNWLKREQPAIRERLEYWIIEPSVRLRQHQEETLRDLPVRWFANWTDLPKEGVHGVIFSNELLDAMPVHRLGWDATAKQWFEWGVAEQQGEFVWKRMEGWVYEWPIVRRILLEEARNLYRVLPDGFLTETNTAAAAWWRNAVRALKRGKLLTFDYGLTTEQFFSPERTNGTLRAYYRHHQNDDLLARPGEQDITAHVNFTVIRDVGEDEGLRTDDFISQERFLARIVERNASNPNLSNNWSAERVRQFQTLTHPQHLGHSFRVLVQGR